MPFFFTSPASAGIETASAGMLKATQCQNPRPVGASGSCTMIAKLCVPAGGSLQNSAGDRFLPLQPNPLNTWSREIGLSLPISGLTRVNFPAPFLVAGHLAGTVFAPAGAPAALGVFPAGGSAPTAKLLARTITKVATARRPLACLKVGRILFLRLLEADLVTSMHRTRRTGI